MVINKKVLTELLTNYQSTGQEKVELIFSALEQVQSVLKSLSKDHAELAKDILGEPLDAEPIIKPYFLPQEVLVSMMQSLVAELAKLSSLPDNQWKKDERVRESLNMLMKCSSTATTLKLSDLLKQIKESVEAEANKAIHVELKRTGSDCNISVDLGLVKELFKQFTIGSLRFAMAKSPFILQLTNESSQEGLFIRGVFDHNFRGYNEPRTLYTWTQENYPIFLVLVFGITRFPGFELVHGPSLTRIKFPVRVVSRVSVEHVDTRMIKRK